MITKNEIRKINKIKRAEMDIAEVEKKSSAAAAIFVASEVYQKAGQIMLYMPLGNEMDTTDIIKAAFGDGKQLAFPVMDEKTERIVPVYALEDTDFKKGMFSVMEPYGTSVADLLQIDVILVPGVAFDKKGARIGFGKGCYDAFLKKCNAAKIGVCYDFQICDKIPAEEHDIKMDFLLTESGLKKCED